MDFKYEALNMLKALFTKTQFADAKLKDGTIVSAEKLEAGQDLFVITEDGRTPAPDGEHILEDGSVVFVTGGKIDKIVAAEKLEVEKEEMAVEVEIEPMIEEVDKKDELEMLKTMCQAIEEKCKKIEEEMGKKMEMMEEKMTKMENYKKETDEAFSNGIIELSENFSKIPGAEKAQITPQDSESKFNRTHKLGKKDSIIDWISKNNKS